MENNGRKMFIALLGLILLKQTITEARVTCHSSEQHKSGGSLYITVSNSEECDEGRWKVNDQVVAHDVDSNKSLVQSHGRSNIIFYICLMNITYVCDRKDIVCEYVCPANPEKIYSHDPRALAGGLIATFITLFIIGITVWLWLRRRAQKEMLPVPVIQITSEA